MTQAIYRNFLTKDNLAVIAVIKKGRKEPDWFAPFEDSGLTPYLATNSDLPWNVDEINSIFSSNKWKRVLIVTDKIEAYETALTLMALQTGYEVFVAVPSFNTTSESRTIRLRLLSAIIMTIDEAIEELNFPHPISD